MGREEKEMSTEIHYQWTRQS